ncbi:MAG: hypothetical protein JWO38_4218 [Gemmataceae bacterium]|nr:hypothetical protein [Gemmataceae bacterium]
MAPRSGSPYGPEGEDQPRAKGLLGRLRERLQKRIEELQKQAEEQSSRQVKNNPNRTEPIRNPDRGNPPDRRDRKKKRRK